MKDFNYSFARSVYVKENSWQSPIYKAFLQPIFKEAEEEVTIIGKIRKEKYLYLGPSTHDLTKLGEAARVVDSSGKNYCIKDAQKIFVGDQVFYIRAILEKEGA